MAYQEYFISEYGIFTDLFPVWGKIEVQFGMNWRKKVKLP